MNSYYPPDHMYNVPTRHYQLPHQSSSVGMGKPADSHTERWGSGNLTPPYHMPASSSWGNYGKKQQVHQRLPPTPPSYSLFSPSTSNNQYNIIENDYHEQELLPPVQNTPLSPPVSEGFLSQDLASQDPNQAWLHPYEAKSESTNNIPLLGSSPLMVNSYNTNISGMLHMPPSGENRKSSAEDLSCRLAQRKKRRLTEPGDANYHCQTCGKYFSRIWNYNAHRETHDPTRPKPHICQIASCQKAFVRRTDLTRHIQCVHAKDKKFQCSLCNSRFARKDTLRRHEDDGCPKRVDIQSRNRKSSSALAWTSWALRFPPPPDCYSYSGSRLQHQQQPMLDHGPSSYLPPLSVALSSRTQGEQGSMLMS